jgi:pilus assembly protein CpaB
MPLRNLPIKTGHLFLGLAALMFIITVAVFSGGSGKKAAVAPKHVEKVPTQKVVVPLIPVSEGKTLTMNDVTSVEWPSAYLPKGATFEDPYQVTGRVAMQNLFPGEPIFKEKVSGSNTHGGLPAIIPNGLRAVSIAVTEVKGVAGFVKPGDHVDVLSTFQVGKEDGSKDSTHISRTVLQNVLVLASAQTMVDDTKYSMETPEGVTRGKATKDEAPGTGAAASTPAAPKSDADKQKEADQAKADDASQTAHLVSSVTLALTPEQSETLALAEETGDLRLALRPETDQATTEVGGVSFDDLVGKGSAPVFHDPEPSGQMPPRAHLPAAMPAMSAGSQVEVIQGTEKTMQNFD